MAISSEIPSYKVLEIVNLFHDVSERHGDGQIDTGDAKRVLLDLHAKALVLGINLPAVEDVLAAPVNNFAHIHLRFQDIVDRLSEGSLDEKHALVEVEKLQVIAKEQKIPLLGGIALVKDLAAKMKGERAATREEWDEFEDEYSSSEESIEEYDD